MKSKKIVPLLMLSFIFPAVVSAWSPSKPFVDGAGVLIDCTGNVVNNSKARVQDHDPALAWNGKNFGMVWVTDGTKLMFASLGADGKRVSGPRLLYDCHKPFDGYYVEYPDIVWTGGSYLVIYSDAKNGRTYFSLQVSASGAVLNGPVNLKTEPSWTYEWGGSLAWNGSAAGFVYVNQDKNLYFKRLSKAGALVGSKVLLASNAGHARYSSRQFARIAWSGKEFGVAWITLNGSAINYQAVSTTGAPIGGRASCAKTSGEFQFLSLTAGKSGTSTFALAYSEYLINVRTVVYFSQISRTGKLLHKAVNARNLPLDSRYVGDWPRVFWSASKGAYYVTWQDNRKSPDSDPYDITSYYNFFLRKIKTNGTFGSAEMMLNVAYKDTGYNILECGAALGGSRLCIGFIRSMATNVTDPSKRHYRAHSVSVTAR